jgi:peptidoglycan/LPS O-acetylase OafA/YrhL
MAAKAPGAQQGKTSPPTFQRREPDGPERSSSGVTHRLVPELDGVRGIAVLLVMLFHSSNIQPIDPPQGLHFLHLPKLIGLGWSGVDLFFVLSGFLITGILLDSRDSKNYFSSFYARRALRILPLYFITVIGYFHLVLPVAHHFGTSRSLDNSLELWYWLHLSNWKLAYAAPGAGLLTHFWSLAIEEQFYVFWPLIAFFAGRKRLQYVCLTLIGLSFGLRCVYAQHNLAGPVLYELTPFRIEPLAFGSLAAVLVRGSKLPSLKSRRLLFGIATCGALILSAVILKGRSANFEHPPMATYGFSALAIMYACLVVYAYVHSGSSDWLAAQLRKPFFRSFGKYSYAIYVFHLPLFIVYGGAVTKVSAVMPEQARFVFWLFALAVGIGLSYAVARISWHLVEKRFWDLKDRFSVRY